MMNIKTKLIGAFLAICFAALMPAAHAASTDVNYLIVTACGGPTYVAGTNRQGTMDVHGNICGSSSGGGSGTFSQTASAAGSGTLQSAAVASGNGTPATVTGYSSLVVTVNCSACSGGTTVNFEASEDGTNYTSVTAVLLGTTTLASSTTTSGITIWQTPVAGFTLFRARISAYSAGTITVTYHTVPVDFNSRTINAIQYDGNGAAANFSTFNPILSGVGGGMTQETISASGASTSNITATLAAPPANKTLYLTGFSVTCQHVAALVDTSITVSNLVTGNQTYEISETTTGANLARNFSTPVSATATATAIVVQLNLIAGGGTCAVNAEGVYL